MTLSDTDIMNHLETDLGITPIDVEEQVQPASVDLRLQGELHVFEQSDEPLDTREEAEPEEVRTGEELILYPGEFAIASTVEEVEIPDYLSAEVKGRSSIGRLGFHIHTAGWVDPGFEGQITLELVNHSPRPVILHSDMRVCQIVFNMLSSPAETPYGEKANSKYQGQKGPTASRIDQDF